MIERKDGRTRTRDVLGALDRDAEQGTFEQPRERRAKPPPRVPLVATHPRMLPGAC